jgi:hypothetical protein
VEPIIVWVATWRMVGYDSPFLLQRQFDEKFGELV